jgi:glucose/arabinose dehydrogenase
MANDHIGTIQFKKNKIKLERVLRGYEIIWGFDFIDENNIVFTQKNGQLFHFDILSKKVAEIKGVPAVVDKGQGGLLDVKKSPHYTKNKKLYFTYSHSNGNAYTTRLAYAELDLKNKKLKDILVLFTAEPYFKTKHHYGSRISFDNKGHLFISVGDRGQRDLAQSLVTHNGKIIRLKLDGSVPDDNPFVQQNGIKKEIWSFGHRNPQGLYYDLKTDKLYGQEHGPRGGDEINLIEKGSNYGWPIITYGREYTGPKIGEGTHKKGMVQPLKHFTPSIAPSGFLVYRGNAFKYFQGHFFSGALKLRHLNHVYPVKDKLKEIRHFESLNKRVRSIMQSPDDLIYFSTDSGEIYRLKPEL